MAVRCVILSWHLFHKEHEMQRGRAHREVIRILQQLTMGMGMCDVELRPLIGQCVTVVTLLWLR